LALIATDGLALVAAGLAVGAGVSMALARFLRGLLFGIARGDPLTFAAVLVILIGVSTIATWLPARRARRIDPVIVLRGD
jgi:putative ABC transport system permease protein